MTGSPGRGLIESLFDLTVSDKGVIQPSPFLPFMFKPSDPQTPSRQDLLKEIDGSCSFELGKHQAEEAKAEEYIGRPS